MIAPDAFQLSPRSFIILLDILDRFHQQRGVHLQLVRSTTEGLRVTTSIIIPGTTSAVRAHELGAHFFFFIAMFNLKQILEAVATEVSAAAVADIFLGAQLI